LRTKSGTELHNRICNTKTITEEEAESAQEKQQNKQLMATKKPAQEIQILFAHENQQNKQTNTQFK